jgi:hypothetical protein
MQKMEECYDRAFTRTTDEHLIQLLEDRLNLQDPNFVSGFKFPGHKQVIGFHLKRRKEQLDSILLKCENCFDGFHGCRDACLNDMVSTRGSIGYDIKFQKSRIQAKNLLAGPGKYDTQNAAYSDPHYVTHDMFFCTYCSQAHREPQYNQAVANGRGLLPDCPSCALKMQHVKELLYCVNDTRGSNNIGQKALHSTPKYHTNDLVSHIQPLAVGQEIGAGGMSPQERFRFYSAQGNTAFVSVKGNDLQASVGILYYI